MEQISTVSGLSAGQSCLPADLYGSSAGQSSLPAN